MWKASDQDVVGSQSILLLQQETRNESLFSRQQQAKLSQDTDCTRTQAPEQNNELPHGLQQTLLSEAANGPATDVSNMQLDLDNVTLATALGLGGGNLLAQFHRTIGDQHGQAPSELSDLLAATLGVRGMHHLRVAPFVVQVGILIPSVGPRSSGQLCWAK